AVARHAPGRGLEEDLRPLRVVDPLVDVGRPLALLAAGLTGDLVRDTAGPDLGPAVDRRQHRDLPQPALLAAPGAGLLPDLVDRKRPQRAQVRHAGQFGHPAAGQNPDPYVRRARAAVSEDVHPRSPFAGTGRP